MRFSEYYNLKTTQPYLDFVDIPLDTDIPVFVDPSGFRKMKSTFGHELSSLVHIFFDTVLKKIKTGNHAQARKLVASLNERNEFHLGYSKGKSQGKAFGHKSAKSVWQAISQSKASATGLLKDLEDSCLMIHGIGTDMISDAVCNIIRGPLIKYTQEMCEYYNIPMARSVDSGPIWNPVKEIWEHNFVHLPIAGNFGKIILIPKIIVRHRLVYNADSYYRHYLLPVMQEEELSSNSSLVEVLKNGSRRVTKKALLKKYGADKLTIVEETVKRPTVLEKYKESIEKKPSLPLTHDQLSEIEHTKLPNWHDDLKNIKKLPTGKKHATEYEDMIEKLLTSILYPALCNPRKQHEIHNGRKRIDITYTNEANKGFFHWLSLHYPCSFIFVECKNYENDVTNPEVDQLSGRFSPSRGKVGLLVCRKIHNKKLLIQRCKDTAQDDRGFIIPLDDDDLAEIIKNRCIDALSYELPFLRNLFSQLVN